MILLYRGHPSTDYSETPEKAGLSFTENIEGARNYARDYFRLGHIPSYVTTVEFHGEITTSCEKNFRGKSSFELISERYPASKFAAVKTGDGKLVVIFQIEKLKVIRVDKIDSDDPVIANERGHI